MKKTLLSLCLLLPMCLMPLTGCKLITAAPTPGVPQFYSQAALILNDFSGVLAQAQTLFSNAHATGLVTDASYATGMQTFSTIATAGENVGSLIQAEASQANVTSAITALIAQVGAMPAAFGIKDATTQASFTALCASMQTILEAAMTTVQSTSTTTASTPAATASTP